MGQNLSEPKTDKTTTLAENEMFLVTSSSMQGWRVEMEDAHTVELSLADDKDSAYFAVFDGHGSHRYSKYCGKHLHKSLILNAAFAEGNYLTALKSTFLTLDEQLKDDPKLQFQYEPGGTTAVVVLVKGDKIYCANVGDSRAIVSTGGVAEELSHDHKPFHPAEESRICHAGGWIEFNRVNGNLALSRAIGDFCFKGDPSLTPEEQIVIADPEIITVDIKPEHEFIVVACDGVWDVMSNQEVVDFVRRKLAEQMQPKQICESLLDHCLAPDCRMGGLGCDNMTLVIAFFLHGRTFSELTVQCLELVASHDSKGEEQNNGDCSSGDLGCVEGGTAEAQRIHSLPSAGVSKLCSDCSAAATATTSVHSCCASEQINSHEEFSSKGVDLISAVMVGESEFEDPAIESDTLPIETAV